MSGLGYQQTLGAARREVRYPLESGHRRGGPGVRFALALVEHLEGGEVGGAGVAIAQTLRALGA